MSGGIDLLTNDFDLTVDGLVQLTGAGRTCSSASRGEHRRRQRHDQRRRAGTDRRRPDAERRSRRVAARCQCRRDAARNGAITFADAPLAFTTLFSNDGTLTALSRPLFIFAAPPVGTLQINTANTLSLIDLDGAGNAGVVNVNRNQTLDVNGSLGRRLQRHDDALSGIDARHVEQLGAQRRHADGNNGFVGGLGVPDTPAGTSIIKGATLTQTGGPINVPDTDGTLQFDANFTMIGGSFTNSGTVIFNETTNITTAAGYAPATATSQTIVNDATTITDVAGDFNWDGPGVATTTVRGGGVLTLNVNHVDTGDDVFGGTINLEDDGDLSVNVAAASWTMAGTLKKSGAVGGHRHRRRDRSLPVTSSPTTGTLALPAATLSARPTSPSTAD